MPKMAISIPFFLFACVCMNSISAFISSGSGSKPKVVLISQGSFNPPTISHLRLFETARDHLQGTDQVDVIGGIISPIHESYKKSYPLVSNEHRRNMVSLAISSSDWIRLSDFGLNQSHWMSLKEILQFHQSRINSILNGELESIPSWLPANITELIGQHVQVQFLCGADLLQRMANSKNDCPDTSKCEQWKAEEDAEILYNYGWMVVSRGNIDSRRLIFNDELLFKHRANITVAEEWVPTGLSSTLVRMHLRRGLSVKYLIHDDVIDYIHRNKLYL